MAEIHYAADDENGRIILLSKMVEEWGLRRGNLYQLNTTNLVSSLADLAQRKSG